MADSPLYILSDDLVAAMEGAENSIGVLLFRLSNLATFLESGEVEDITLSTRRDISAVAIAFRRLLHKTQRSATVWEEVKAALNDGLLGECEDAASADDEDDDLEWQMLRWDEERGVAL